jgi:hypothetical protein
MAAIAPSSAVAAAISPAVEPAAGQRLRECFSSQRLLMLNTAHVDIELRPAGNLCLAADNTLIITI